LGYSNVVELGNIFDPIQWFDSAGISTNTGYGSDGGQWINLTPTAVASNAYGGGTSLRIGRPEFSRFAFTNLGGTSPVPNMGLSSVALLDIFSLSDSYDNGGRINLNTAPEQVLELAFQVLGAGAGEASQIAAAVIDWRDRDELEHIKGGAEKSYYAGLNPPYAPKDGPFDDISELLKVRGVTPALFWGGRSSAPPPPPGPRDRRQPISLVAVDGTGAGLADVFTAISANRVNVNTAPLPVLRVLLGGDENIALQVLQRRAGPDGVDGTEDDQPYRNAAEIPGATAGPLNSFSTQSGTFQIRVDARLGSARKRFVGVLRRGAGRDGQLMLFHPE
jgi:DNA uptake protein ComE-like DNA-binding protein